MALAFVRPLGSPAAVDIRSQLLMRVFGETSDYTASLAAAYGDRASESPLRELALQVTPSRSMTAFGADVASVPTFSGMTTVAYAGDPYGLSQLARERVLDTSAHFDPPPVPQGDSGAQAASFIHVIPSAAYTVGTYRPVDPVPNVSPAPGALSFGPLARTPSDIAGIAASDLGYNGGDSVGGATSGNAGVVPATAHVGPVQFQTRIEGSSLQAGDLGLDDNAYGAGANFDVRAGSRKVNVDVSSTYEHLTRNDASTFSAPQMGPASSWQLPGADTPLTVPNFADVSKVSVGAALAVPVVNGVTLKVNYGADRMFGGYGLPGLANLDSTDASYGGKLTFAIPHSSSTLSISASQSRFIDSVLSTNAFTQTRGDVNFTVKF
jgi:hypothetical protein